MLRTEKVREKRDKPNEYNNNGGNEHVAITDMRKFVRNNSFKFCLIQNLQSPVVTATTACSASRPVANAFGD